MNKQTENRLRQLAEFAWMGIDENDDINSFNIFAGMTPDDKANPDLYLLGLLSNPDNFYLTCRLLLDIECPPQQCIVLKELWMHKFPMLIGSRGFGKSFLLALYAVLRATFLQGRKIVVTGAGFRQAKTFINYVEKIWHNAPVLKSLFNVASQKQGPSHEPDRWMVRIGESTITGLPLGDGETIRGERANDNIADEFASIPKDIFERVVVGFGVVSHDPVKKMQNISELRFLERHKLITSEEVEAELSTLSLDNQLILSGTAYYDFNHFAQYYRRYKAIIESGGSEKRIKEILAEQGDSVDLPKGFNYKDFCVMRIPSELVPEGFLDAGQLARSRITMHAGMYEMEYGCIFSKDSDGFFKRTLIESCVASRGNIISMQNQGLFKDRTPDEMVFSAKNKGQKDFKYAFGIDPASQVDNFSIVVLELHGDHRRIVFTWTFSKTKYNELIKKNIITNHTFYSYCAAKIKELMKIFPTEDIGIDTQGGGHEIIDALSKADKENGELPILPMIFPDKKQETDGMTGLHYIYPCQFVDNKWLNEANHGLRKDLEDKLLLFPQIDSITLSEAGIEDNLNNREYDTLEDCVWEIEELKDEMATIIHTQTLNGRDQWDTPDEKLPGGKKGRQRKDRYSALLMANFVARNKHKMGDRTLYSDGYHRGQTSNMYIGPDWFVRGSESFGV